MQGKAALTTVADVIKVWLIIVNCFFTGGGVKFLQLPFL